MSLEGMKHRIFFTIVAAIAFAVAISVSAKCFMLCKHERTLFPGVKLQYFSDRYSRLTWEGFGIVANGRFYLGIWNDGVFTCSCDASKICYLDFRHHRVIRDIQTISDMDKDVRVLFFTDVQTAMGIYTDYGRIPFEAALQELDKRLQTER